jgi:RNA polymerase sigma factor (sigma-70 family)
VATALQIDWAVHAPRATLARHAARCISSSAAVVASDDASSFEREFLALLPWLERVIAFTARRYQLSPQDADDFASRVKLKLIDDNYAVFRKFEGRSKLQTFLVTVIQREAVEFERAQRGKWHPSAEASRGGRVLELLERYLVRDQYSWEEACETLRTRHGVTLAAAELEQLAARLPTRFPRKFEPTDVLDVVPSLALTPEQHLLREERERLLARFRESLRRFTAQLPEQDALILAYRFEDGRKVADIARALALDQKPLYRRLDRLVASLTEHLEREGLAGNVVRGLIDDSGVHA